MPPRLLVGAVDIETVAADGSADLHGEVQFAVVEITATDSVVGIKVEDDIVDVQDSREDDD